MITLLVCELRLYDNLALVDVFALHIWLLPCCIVFTYFINFCFGND